MGFPAPSTRSLILQQLSSQQQILAVSKLQPIEKIVSLYKDGQRHFGENYIQEALEKIEQLKSTDIQWHLIGPIQKNKIKFLKTHFSYIHSVDSFILAEKISEHSLANNHIQKVFLQINLSEEPTKSGFSRHEFESEWGRLKELKGLQIVGLMTMPPLENEPEKNRAFFKELKYIGSKFDLHEYSMGTSHDYQIALQEGATWIRLGTTLFGERESQKDQKRGPS